MTDKFTFDHLFDKPQIPFDEEIAKARQQLKPANVDAVLSKLHGIRSTINDLIEEVHCHAWCPREYGGRLNSSGTWDPNPTSPNSGKFIPVHPGYPNTMIPPETLLYYSFGTEFKNYGFRNIEETTLTTFGFEGIFAANILSIPDEVAQHFLIDSMMFGARLLWFSSNVDAKKFAASVSTPIPIAQYARPGLDVCMGVRNKTKEPQHFSAKLIGFERPAGR